MAELLFFNWQSVTRWVALSLYSPVLGFPQGIIPTRSHFIMQLEQREEPWIPAQVEMTPATEKEPHMGHGEWTQRRVGCQGWVQIQKYQLFLPVFDFKSYVGVCTVKKKIHLHCRRHRFNPWVGKIAKRGAWQPNSSILAWEVSWTEEPGGL